MNIYGDSEVESGIKGVSDERRGGGGGGGGDPLNASSLDDIVEGSITRVGSSLATAGVVPLVFVNEFARCDGHQQSQRRIRGGSAELSTVSIVSSLATTLRSSCFEGLQNMLDTTLQVPENMIIPRGRLRLLRSQVLGKGAFGEVVRGELYTSSVVEPESSTKLGARCTVFSPCSLHMFSENNAVAGVEGVHTERNRDTAEGGCGSAGDNPSRRGGGMGQNCERSVNGNDDNCSCSSRDVLTLAGDFPGSSNVEVAGECSMKLEVDAPSMLYLAEPPSLQVTSSAYVSSENGTSFPNPTLQLVSTSGTGTTPEDDLPSVSMSFSTEEPPRAVAVKTVRKAKLSRRHKFLASFKMELHFASTLHHPSLIDVYGVAEEDTELFLVMDPAEGGTVLDYIRTQNYETILNMAPRFLAPVVLGLEYLHSLGIAHRDIKPSNMLLASNYRVKLADFGSACYLNDSAANTFGGTAAYMSPEMVETGMASATSDLWALGCVLFELLVGRTPFQAENHMFVMRRIKEYQNGSFDFPHYFPLQAEDLLLRLLQREPEDRLGSEATGGFNALKAHPFFAGIDWCNVHGTPSIAPRCMNYCKQLESLLRVGENLVCCSKVLRKSHRFLRKEWRCHLLALTDLPRLLYLDATTYAMERSIPLTRELYAEVHDSERFRIVTKRRKYELFDPEKHADHWGMRINDVVKGLHAVVGGVGHSGFTSSDMVLYNKCTAGGSLHHWRSCKE